MSQAKAAIIGAGSFVFGPSVLKQAIIKHRLDGLELAMMDPNRAAVELMAGVGRRMARELGVKATITSHTDRETTLDGADFVICSAARELWRRFEMDCAIIRRHCPDHLITEFGGIAGISYSLRQIALIQEIVGDMKRLCPKAWLLDVANPLPRVAQAAHEEGVPTAGFCSVALSAYASPPPPGSSARPATCPPAATTTSRTSSCRAATSPTAPPPATATRWPKVPRQSARRSRSFGSSSMQRMRKERPVAAVAGGRPVGVSGSARTGKISRRVVPLLGALSISMSPLWRRIIP